MAKQKIEAGQTRRIGNTGATYFIHAFSRWLGKASWVVEWGEKSATAKRFDVGRRTEDAILGDMLMRDAKGNEIEPAKVLEARTEVGVDGEGWVVMNLPGIGDRRAESAQQGKGRDGWTCIGFEFEEAPGVIYSQAQGWVDPNPHTNLVSNIVQVLRRFCFTKRVIANVAVWERASG